MNRPALLAILAAALLAAPARAQADSLYNEEFGDLTGGVLTGAGEVDAETASEQCPRPGPGGTLAWAAEPGCRPSGPELLGRADTVFFYAGRYLRNAEQAEPGDESTVGDEAVVVFSQPLSGGPLRPEWHARYAREFIVSVTPLVAPEAGGGALMSLLACVNGTMGCMQEFLLRRDGAWRPVQSAWYDGLPAGLGDMNKGSYIDPRTLQGEAGLYGPDDPNCCPGSILYFRVLLRGNTLVLRDHHVVRELAPD